MSLVYQINAIFSCEESFSLLKNISFKMQCYTDRQTDRQTPAIPNGSSECFSSETRFCVQIVALLCVCVCVCLQAGVSVPEAGSSADGGGRGRTGPSEHRCAGS